MKRLIAICCLGLVAATKIESISIDTHPIRIVAGREWDFREAISWWHERQSIKNAGALVNNAVIRKDTEQRRKANDAMAPRWSQYVVQGREVEKIGNARLIEELAPKKRMILVTNAPAHWSTDTPLLAVPTGSTPIRTMIVTVFDYGTPKTESKSKSPGVKDGAKK